MRRLLYIAAAVIATVFYCAGLSAQETATEKINKKNLIIKEWNSDPSGRNRSLDHVTTYSADGKKYEEIEYDSDGQKKWTKRYEYGALDKVEKELLYDGRNRLVQIKKFDYNEFGRKKTQYNYTAKGKLVSIKQFEYIVEDAE